MKQTRIQALLLQHQITLFPQIGFSSAALYPQLSEGVPHVRGNSLLLVRNVCVEV